MKSFWKFKISLHKAYFEKGLGITNFMKYPIALLGVSNFVVAGNVNWTIFFVVAYLIGCYLLGWAWFNKGFYEEEQEVNNQFNRFVREMRTKH